MKTAVLAAALAAGSASAGVLVVRDTATILSDISSIQSQVQSLATAVNGFSGITDTTGLTNLISAEGDLQTSIDKGTSDAKATSQVSESDANQVLTAVKNLIPDIVSALNAVVAKDPTFASAGVGTVVSGDLTSLKSSTDAFASALIAIAPADTQDAAHAAQSCIDAAFSAAMATSSASDSCTTNISIGSGSSSPTSSSGSSAPTSSAPGSTSTPIGMSTTPSSSSAPAPTSSAPSSSAPATSSGAAVPITTSVTSSKPTSTSGSGSASGTGVGPSTPMFSGAADSVKVGLSGAMAVAALALAL